MRSMRPGRRLAAPVPASSTALAMTLWAGLASAQPAPGAIGAAPAPPPRPAAAPPPPAAAPDRVGPVEVPSRSERPASGRTLSLAACVAIALRDNPDVQSSDSSVRGAEANLAEVRGAFGPKLHFDGNVQWWNSAFTIPFGP